MNIHLNNPALLFILNFRCTLSTTFQPIPAPTIPPTKLLISKPLLPPPTTTNSPPTESARSLSTASAGSPTTALILMTKAKSNLVTSFRVWVSVGMETSATLAMTSKFAQISWNKNARGGNIVPIDTCIKAAPILIWDSASRERPANSNISSVSSAGTTCTGIARREPSVQTITPRYSFRKTSKALKNYSNSYPKQIHSTIFATIARKSAIKSANVPKEWRYSPRTFSNVASAATCTHSQTTATIRLDN